MLKALTLDSNQCPIEGDSVMSTNLVVNRAATVTKIEKQRKQKKTISSTSSPTIVRQYLELQRLRDRLAKEESWRAAK